MGKKLKDGRSLAVVSRDMTAVLHGEDSLDDWDDEELLHGRRRDKGGRFRGPWPTSASPTSTPPLPIGLSSNATATDGSPSQARRTRSTS